MNNYWSTYVQFSEELYRSRALRFNDKNKDLWLETLQAKDGMDILEVGCGGGVFCHRIKSYLPKASVTGIDLDTEHIEYAKMKSKEFGLTCNFMCGDATQLPFEDNTFDLCFSHTVITFCEPSVFIKEQHRVLKNGGTIVVMNVVGGVNSEMWKPGNDDAEKELFDRLWKEAEKNQLSNMKKYNMTLNEYPVYLEKAGFRDVRVDMLPVISYCPDNFDIDEETALEQINENRFSELCSVEKACRMAPHALSKAEYGKLISMINLRYDERIKKYRKKEKLWDLSTSVVFAVSGGK